MIAMVFAHAGHILIDGPLFLGPVVLLGGALWISSRRERRRKEEAERRRAA